MKFFRLILGFLFVTSSLSVVAQQQMVVRGQFTDQGIQLNWYPESAREWYQQLEEGYTIKRREVDGLGNSHSSTLASKLLPKDSVWFDANKNKIQGLMEPVGSLLYDPAFNFGGDNDLMSDVEMKFNFLVYETIQRFEVAEALGMGYLDSTAQAGKRYEYIIEAINSTLKGDVVITAELDTEVQNPEENPVDFEFLGGKSLSDMLAASQPFVLHEIKGLALPMGDSIILRWGPSTPEAWDRAKTDGYQIYRSRQGGEIQLITTVFPWPEERIDESIQEDSMAILAATLLYQHNLGQDADMNFVQRSAMFDNFHGFSLFAADRSPLAADILGLRFVDKDVLRDTLYEYYITTPFVENGFFGATIYAFNTPRPAPIPMGFKSIPQDKAIKLVWDKTANERKFSAYHIERSEDGETYQRLNENPLVFAESRQFPMSEFFFVDSVETNYKTYYYRLTGSNAFGTWSDFATVEGQAVDLTPPPAPFILDADYEKSTNAVKITWKPSLAEDLANYQVLYSSIYDGFYSAVSPLIDKDSTAFDWLIEGVDTDREIYIKIQTADVNGNINESNYFSVIVPDTDDPDVPQGLEAIIDSTGKVFISWNASKAKDVRGYWVFWSNSIDDEMSAINGFILEDTLLTWQVDDKTLNEYMWFCVASEDNSYNKSDMSEAIKVARPDKVPPVPPVLLPVSVENDYMQLTWLPSTSSDVTQQFVYRQRRDNNEPREVIDTLGPFVNTYFDTSLVFEKNYDYHIRAMDDAGNYSGFSNKGFGKLPFPKSKVLVKDFMVEIKTGEDGTSKVVLKWEYQPLNREIARMPVAFEVYRSTGGRDVKKMTSTQAWSFFDNDIQQNVLYNYAIRIRYDNGWVGDLSDIKSILVK